MHPVFAPQAAIKGWRRSELLDGGSTKSWAEASTMTIVPSRIKKPAAAKHRKGHISIFRSLYKAIFCSQFGQCQSGSFSHPCICLPSAIHHRDHEKTRFLSVKVRWGASLTWMAFLLSQNEPAVLLPSWSSLLVEWFWAHSKFLNGLPKSDLYKMSSHCNDFVFAIFLFDDERTVDFIWRISFEADPRWVLCQQHSYWCRIEFRKRPYWNIPFFLKWQWGHSLQCCKWKQLTHFFLMLRLGMRLVFANLQNHPGIWPIYLGILGSPVPALSQLVLGLSFHIRFH